MTALGSSTAAIVPPPQKKNDRKKGSFFTLLILSGAQPPIKNGPNKLGKEVEQKTEQTNPGKQDFLKWSPNHQI